VAQNGDAWLFSAPVYFAEIVAGDVAVELYAEPQGNDAAPAVIAMKQETPIPGSINSYIYSAGVPATRPARDYTIRIRPESVGAELPAELGLILWQK